MERQFRTQNQISSFPVFGTIPLSPREENATRFYLLFSFHSISSCCKIIQRFRDELFEKVLIQAPVHSVRSSPHVSFSFLLLRWGDILKWSLHINCCNHFWELFRISCFSNLPHPPALYFGSQNFYSSQWSLETLRSYPGCLHVATWDPSCFWEMRLESLCH